ncbi:putative transcription factor MYB-HB-like family [Helianthus annuus]|uniref:Putative telomeric DNA binding protein 1 n=1 Tax=Helianthus annuus TaxID=4232 RepID=A0A251RWA7_HELAN|nr:telomere repeat-binding protein 4 [Helianthus annuus]XP_022015307.1 telomere repeat-binding protein 4 [Helianthus annuus]KAF5770914.1 putative SANT/Myb domain, Homeobox-like domain superfamily protein [Helianthus annuus]KAJ0487364.1 putative transcription factor MYB-HB-like family [Helianthus annuus]KAJ0855674.1 putative transcription factor MYB-HB-like family [Helianthus annuus]
MVSKKRLYNGGFDGFLAPVVPKAPRSSRRISHKKSSAGSEICPFELLAAVAGKLLQESETSVSSTGPERKEQITVHEEGVKQEPLEVKINPLRLDYLDQGCCGENEFVPVPSNLELKLEPAVKDLPQSDNDSALEHASIVSTSDFSKEVNANVKLETSCDGMMDSKETKVQTNAVEKLSEDFTAVKSCVNHRVLSSSCNNAHLHRNNVKIGIRDDDENYFSFNQHIAKMRALRWQSRPGCRRIRKLLTTTRHWKSAPKLKSYEPSNATSRGVKAFDQDRKNIYMRERCQEATDAKRRKLFHHNSKPDYVQETSSESISNTPKAKSVTSSVINHKSPFQSKDGHVKFSINSFKVPELYIEIPETSTIGSLKRTVVEAVTAILGGELHVGVLLQGEKINDDNTTLQQTGVSLNSDTLGFILEPNLPEASQIEQFEPPSLPPCDNHEPPPPPPPISLASPIMDVGFLNSSVDVDPPVVTCLENITENNQESKQVSIEETVDTKAIVPIRQLNPETLAMVPLNHKVSKKTELSQRRTRRPFSVSEVEALVEAVETLGTGRWRDVKIRAFDDANHRTYVDLKDKWKTLVHTASISPQQRRGEPVPQALLDRVLAAHSFWTQNQLKPHGKHQTEPIQTLPAVKV